MEKRAARMLYFEPNFMDEALVLLDRFGGEARVLAGGTRLGPRLRHDRAGVAALINLKRVDEMQGITRSANVLRIGALVTAAELSAHPEVRACAPVLASAAQSLGARQLRNVATLGGNVCSGDPVSDLTAALLACDARCEIATLHEGPSQTVLEHVVEKPTPVLEAGELLIAVEIPLQPDADARASYQKMMTRRSFELALVAVAVMLHLREGNVTQARIALAGAGRAPLRAREAERSIAGKKLTAETIAAAARQAAQADAQPHDDHRASARYRRNLVEVLTGRALHGAAGARGDGKT
ncbi:MAG TPA: FAD binding domain-containing protein [Candidatus Eremiobacteraceae bacterium]|nr:FAD binding domain-containing protein [Candidatus Eremiobacteraceae bacterium]